MPRAPHPRRTWRRADRRFGMLAVLPALAVLGVFMLYSIGYAFYLSFFKDDGTTKSYVGLRNYSGLLHDPTFWRVALNNLIFLGAVPLILLTSLVTAVLIYEKVWGWKFFRVVFFLPSVISAVVVGILFRVFFASDGPVNSLLGVVGIAPVYWLGSPATAIVVVIIALVWTSFGYGAVVLLAGMSAIDPQVYEAARIDGAGWWSRLGRITLPLVAPVLRFVSVINVAYTFTSLFGFIYVLTSGGPGYSTTTLDYLIYLKGFASFDLGNASALAFILFAIIMALTVAQFRLLGRSEK